MTFSDQYGLTVTGADAAAAAGYDAYVDEFLKYGANLRDLFAVATAYPHAPLLNAHAAALNLAFEGAEGWEAAAPFLDAMRRAIAHATPRETLFAECVDAWARRRYHDALDALDALTDQYPEDLCALKWAQYHAFNLGDVPAMMRLAERARAAQSGAPYVHGIVAFALEQDGRLDEAEAEGRRAVEIALDDAWAHHAVAHVFETRGRPEEGATWLDHCAHTWERKGVFIRDHNWWHAALFRLELDRPGEALAIYDRRLWGAWPEFPQEQIGAVSMLWRLEMRGVDVGARWDPVVAQARRRVGEHVFPFHDLHYLYALARAGAPGEADAFLASMRRHARGVEPRARSAWADACVPCAEAMIAFANDDYARAADRLGAASGALQLVGGSHAQRAVFAEARAAAFAACAARSGAGAGA
ncbi:MAG: tetratricopeptide repeat protein [Pseudomonadota bacterium]